MTIYHYVATSNPNGAKAVLNSFGEQATRDPQVLASQLAGAVRKHGKDALLKIAAVHPDMKLIVDAQAEYNKANEVKEDKPCSCKDKKVDSLFSSAEGQEIKKAVETLTSKQEALSAPKESKSDSKDLMIIGAVAVMALALIMKK